MIPRLAALWQRYWFAEIQSHSYAALRIGLGLVGILGLIGLTPVSMYWAGSGLMPTPGGGLGLRALLTDAGMVGVAGYALYAVLWGSFGCMVIGYRSATAVAAAFIGSALQGFFNSLPLSSSHKVLTALLFCVMWADCSRMWSVDARRGHPPRADGLPTMAIWPLRLVRVQIALIYLGSGLTKLSGELWRDGTAIHYTLQMNVFHRMPVTVPGSAEVLLTVMTYATLAWELGFVALVAYRRTRLLTLWFGVFMHLAMAMLLELGTFSVVMLVGYIAFVNPDTLARVRVRQARTSRAPVLDRSV